MPTSKEKTPRMTHEERAKRRAAIAEFLQQGHTIQEACKKFRVSYPTVYNAAQSAGVTPRTSIRILPVSGFTVLAELLNTTDSQQDIADRFNVTRETINNVARAARAAGIHVR